MSESILRTDTEAVKAGAVDKRENEAVRIVGQMQAILDAFEDAGEPVVMNDELFDDLLPDEHGNPYVGTRRMTRIGAGAKMDAHEFASFTPTYLSISLSQPQDEAVRERYAGGIVNLQYTTKLGERQALDLAIHHGKLWVKELTIAPLGARQTTQEIEDSEALEMLRGGMTRVAHELVEFAAAVRDEAKAARAVHIVKQLVERGAVAEGDLDQDTWPALVELYGEDDE